MPDWGYCLIWAAYAWVLANMILALIIDWKLRQGLPFTAGPNWRGIFWLPGYLKWRRARLADLNEHWNPPAPFIPYPVCQRCGLTHPPADWLDETCPHARPAVRIEKHCPYCGVIHGDSPVETQLCEDEQRSVVRGTE